MKDLVAKIRIGLQDDASKALGSIQTKLVALGTVIAGFFGISLFKASVDSAREFELAMSRVAAASGETAEGMAELERAAKDAGATTQYSSVQAANALEELVKAGLSATNAVNALPAALDLATAGGVDLATAAGFLTQAVAGMGLSFADAGRVADVLAQGANASQTSVEGLAQALSYAAPTANSLGLSLEETVAYIGKFADAGIDASRAGTALNAIMAQFQDPASKFSKALQDAGISSRNFNVAIRQLAAAGPRAEAALLAVGLEAGPALRALVNQGIGALDELQDKLENAQGSARTFAQVMSSNLDGAFKGLSSAWDGLKIAMGKPVLEPLARQVNAVAERLRAFVADGTASQFGQAIKEAFDAAGKWAAEFFAKVDFSALAASMRGYAADLQATLTDLGNRATAASNVMSMAWAVMSTGLATVRTAIYSLGAGMSWLASAFLADLATISDGLAKITFGDLSAGFSNAADKMRAEARATYAVYEEMSRNSGEAFAGIVEGVDKVGAATEAMKRSAAEAAPEVAKVGTSAAGAAVQTEALAKELEGVALGLKDFTSQQVAQKLDEISRATGFTVKSTRELRDAVADGYIYFNDASGAWQKGTTNLANLTQTTGDAEAAMRGFVNQVGAGASAGVQQLGAKSAETAAKLKELREQYQAFIAAGDTQGAAGVQQQISALQGLGKQAEQTGEQAAGAADNLKKVGDAGQDVGDKVQYASINLKSTGAAAAEAGAGMEDVAEASDAAGESMGGAGGAAAAMAKIIGMLEDRIGAYSQSALAMVKAAQSQAISFTDVANRVRQVGVAAGQLVAEDQVGQLQAQFDELSAAARAAAEQAREIESFKGFRGEGWAGFDKYTASLVAVEGALANAKARLVDLDIQVARFNERVDEGNIPLAQQERQLQGLVTQAERLGSQQLIGLRSALDDVRRQMQDLADSARDTLGSIQDELDQIDGNYEAIEKRRLASRRDDIEAQLAEAKAAGNAAAVAALTKALSALERLEDARIKEARERAREAERSKGEKGSSKGGSSGGTNGAGGATGTNGRGAVGPKYRVAVPNVIINLQAGVDLKNRQEATTIARILLPEIKNLVRLGHRIEPSIR